MRRNNRRSKKIKTWACLLAYLWTINADSSTISSLGRRLTTLAKHQVGGEVPPSLPPLDLAEEIEFIQRRYNEARALLVPQMEDSEEGAGDGDKAALLAHAIRLLSANMRQWESIEYRSRSSTGTGPGPTYEEALLIMAKNRATLGQAYARQGELEKALEELEVACPVLHALSKRHSSSSSLSTRSSSRTAAARQGGDKALPTSSSSSSTIWMPSASDSIEGLEASEGFIPCYAAMNIIFNDVQAKYPDSVIGRGGGEESSSAFELFTTDSPHAAKLQTLAMISKLSALSQANPEQFGLPKRVAWGAAKAMRAHLHELVKQMTLVDVEGEYARLLEKAKAWNSICEQDLRHALDSLLHDDLTLSIPSSEGGPQSPDDKKSESEFLLSELRREGAMYIEGMEKATGSGWNVLDDAIRQSDEEMYEALKQQREEGVSSLLGVPDGFQSFSEVLKMIKNIYLTTRAERIAALNHRQASSRSLHEALTGEDPATRYSSSSRTADGRRSSSSSSNSKKKSSSTSSSRSSSTLASTIGAWLPTISIISALIAFIGFLLSSTPFRRSSKAKARQRTALAAAALRHRSASTEGSSSSSDSSSCSSQEKKGEGDRRWLLLAREYRHARHHLLTRWEASLERWGPFLQKWIAVMLSRAASLASIVRQLMALLRSPFSSSSSSAASSSSISKEEESQRQPFPSSSSTTPITGESSFSSAAAASVEKKMERSNSSSKHKKSRSTGGMKAASKTTSIPTTTKTSSSTTTTASAATEELVDQVENESGRRGRRRSPDKHKSGQSRGSSTDSTTSQTSSEPSLLDAAAMMMGGSESAGPSDSLGPSSRNDGGQSNGSTTSQTSSDEEMSKEEEQQQQEEEEVMVDLLSEKKGEVMKKDDGNDGNSLTEKKEGEMMKEDGGDLLTEKESGVSSISSSSSAAAAGGMESEGQRVMVEEKRIKEEKEGVVEEEEAVKGDQPSPPLMEDKGNQQSSEMEGVKGEKLATVAAGGAADVESKKKKKAKKAVVPTSEKPFEATAATPAKSVIPPSSLPVRVEKTEGEGSASHRRSRFSFPAREEEGHSCNKSSPARRAREVGGHFGSSRSIPLSEEEQSSSLTMALKAQLGLKQSKGGDDTHLVGSRIAYHEQAGLGGRGPVTTVAVLESMLASEARQQQHEVEKQGHAEDHSAHPSPPTRVPTQREGGIRISIPTPTLVSSAPSSSFSTYLPPNEQHEGGSSEGGGEISPWEGQGAAAGGGEGPSPPTAQYYHHPMPQYHPPHPLQQHQHHRPASVDHPTFLHPPPHQQHHHHYSPYPSPTSDLSPHSPPFGYMIAPSPSPPLPAYHGGSAAYLSAPVSPVSPRPPPFLPSMPKEHLVDVLKHQIEYYFSLENLYKDLYLRKQMDAEGWVSLAEICAFNRMRQLMSSGADMHLIVESLQDSRRVELSMPKTPSTDCSTEILYGCKVRTRDHPERWVLQKMDGSQEEKGGLPLTTYYAD